MGNYGWIKLHRKILDNPIFTSKDSFLIQLWLYILLSVNHKPKRLLFNKKEMVIESGQGIFGLNQIVKDCTNLKKEDSSKFKKYKTIYYRRLKILQNLGNVKLNPTNKFTLITVINWDKYQGIETQVKLKRNSSETQVKTNKNDKNIKNVKKEVLFETFWNKYPNKKAKKKALQVWDKLLFEEGLFEKIINALERFKFSKEWKEKNGTFIPYPATWLNQERWKDEIDYKSKKSREVKLNTDSEIRAYMQS